MQARLDGPRSSCAAAARLHRPPFVAPRAAARSSRSTHAAGAAGGDLYLGIDFGTSGARACVIDGLVWLAIRAWLQAYVGCLLPCLLPSHAATYTLPHPPLPHHSDARISAEAATGYDGSSALDEAWASALWRLLGELPAAARARVAALAIDGARVQLAGVRSDGSTARRRAAANRWLLPAHTCLTTPRHTPQAPVPPHC